MANPVPETLPPFFSAPNVRHARYEELYSRELLLDITTFIRNLIKFTPDGERWGRLVGDEWRAELMCTIILNYLEDRRTRERSLWMEERLRTSAPGSPEVPHDPRFHLDNARGIGQITDLVRQGLPIFCNKWFSDDLLLIKKRTVN